MLALTIACKVGQGRGENIKAAGSRQQLSCFIFPSSRAMRRETSSQLLLKVVLVELHGRQLGGFGFLNLVVCGAS